MKDLMPAPVSVMRLSDAMQAADVRPAQGMDSADTIYPPPLLPEHAMQILSSQSSPLHEPIPCDTLYPLTESDIQILLQAKAMLTNFTSEPSLTSASLPSKTKTSVTATERRQHLDSWMYMNAVVHRPRRIELGGKNLMLHPLMAPDVEMLEKIIVHQVQAPEQMVKWYLAWLEIVCMLTRD